MDGLRFCLKDMSFLLVRDRGKPLFRNRPGLVILTLFTRRVLLKKVVATRNEFMSYYEAKIAFEWH